MFKAIFDFIKSLFGWGEDVVQLGNTTLDVAQANANLWLKETVKECRTKEAELDITDEEVAEYLQAIRNRKR